MKADTTPEDDQINTLREAVIAKLRELNAIRTEAVEEAFRTVPRHLFMPETPREKAHAAEYAQITKKDDNGVNISSVSAARIQAFMLEQADIRPGMRVLEIGSGGLNAAYIAELVGEDGEVTTIDIDPDVTDRAGRCLGEAGYEHVNVALTDGEEGMPEHAPYDRIIVTVGAWDIPPAWLDQLTEDGRLVVPLRVRGLTRSIAFEREDGHLVSQGYELCGFVPMQGAGEYRVRLALLHDEKGEEVGLRLDDGQRADTERLREAMAQPHAEVWSKVTIGGMEPFDNLDLWLATVLPDFALLTATVAARDKGLVPSASPMGIPTLIDGGSFSYRTVRPLGDEWTTFEFGAYGHGPHAQKDAERLVELIQTWDREHRRHRARFEVHPLTGDSVTGDTATGVVSPDTPAELVVAKRHTRVTVSWPTEQS
ncbi:methyltransferase, FxLD system [Streptomyces sp. NPDC002845]